MKPVTLHDNGRLRRIAGVLPRALPAVLEELACGNRHAVSVVFLRDLRNLDALTNGVELFASALRSARPPLEVLPLPEPAEGGDGDGGRSFELECDRAAAYTRLADFAESDQGGRQLLILTTPEAFFAPAPAREQIRTHEIQLAAGTCVNFEQLRADLGAKLDYDCEAVCEYPGQFAVRGGIIDVYPVNAHCPYRIDFFGDEIEEIRAFDPTTQRSLETVLALTIAARPGRAPDARVGTIFDYFGGPVSWIFVEPAALADAHPARFQQFERSVTPTLTFADLQRERGPAADDWIVLQEIEEDFSLFPPGVAAHSLAVESLEFYREHATDDAFGLERFESEQAARAAFIRQLARWQQAGEAVWVVTPSSGEETRLVEIFAEHATEAGAAFRPHFVRGALPAGFRFVASAPAESAVPFRFSWDGLRPGCAAVVVTDGELLGRFRTHTAASRKRKLPTRKRVDQLLDFSELVEGDHLVHLSHGVCLFRGLTQMELRGRTQEVISVEFADSVTLHVPLHESHLLTRYVGLSKVAPKLGKIGTSGWEKTRRAAERATLDFAAQLLKTQAERAHIGGTPFPPDTEWQKAFEDAFPHVETPDQATAIVDTKRDMERDQPMDRLICGDVGFGKTEVAIRAAFKAVMDNRQVAVLVPTTILAQQHFLTFRDRMADYPVTVEMISRFRSAAQQDEIVAQLAEGKIDIIVGTHRLLSDDVQFKNLGLLVIDEEHRFGVRHKEKLKHLRSHVDILTMSATPIPRTLYMALMGARDLSLIETPPEDRLPIRTVVKSYDPDLVRSAIRAELDRGGQVFYLHNRVQSIEAVAARIEELVPDARIAVGHGQMHEHTLERVMARFVAGEYDILVCTTIIENGLDIPNCNTIIIEGADRFGLSQLYQLRGRVGRFNRQAYAYLLLHRHARVIDQARKRLSAMRQYTQLGAGFKIAMRDLELRGAGNLLGPQQSGHIAGVGFELYCQLLRQSIGRLKGDPVASHIRATVSIDFITMGEGELDWLGPERGIDVLVEDEIGDHRIPPVPANIPMSYIGETRLRIDFYRKLALAAATDEVDAIEAALRDRFGPPPEPVLHLLAVTRLRTLAESAGLASVETRANQLKCLRASGKHDDFVKVANRFPRLTAKTPNLRLREIEQFLRRLRPPS